MCHRDTLGANATEKFSYRVKNCVTAGECDSDANELLMIFSTSERISNYSADELPR